MTISYSILILRFLGYLNFSIRLLCTSYVTEKEKKNIAGLRLQEEEVLLTIDYTI